MSLVFLIVAAGRGTRVGGDIPKQYRNLSGKPVLQHCIENLLSVSLDAHISVVVAPSDHAPFEQIVRDIDDERLLPAVNGGDQRHISVRNGLESLKHIAPAKVLIHDAARPFTPHEVIYRVVNALDEHQAAFPILEVVDAVWRIEDGIVKSAEQREGLARAQTPQGFDYAAILDAHRNHSGEASDDVMVAHRAGLLIKTVAGSEENFKITLPSDFENAEKLLG